MGRVDEFARVDEGVRETAYGLEGGASVGEPVDGDAGPVDALDDDEEVGVGLREEPVAEVLGGAEPVVVVAEAPVGVVPDVAADLVVEVRAHDTLVVPVAAGHEQPVVLPLRGGPARVPALVAVHSAAPTGGVGVVVEDDREAGVGESAHDGVVHLERGAPPQAGVGGDGVVGDGARVVDHLVGEGQPDAVDPELLETGDDLGHGCAVEAERYPVCVLPA
ncbi:hypothetical protein SHKM778_50320 [Streptomyces sp. KM77-8]|uniref:Uncharacterized protein n=1 Tax=Streptomyces haneummycinicus TaxID=3074435 RepID=A0AAT9HM84_9ACTN